jgi:hypothetical protein
VAGAHVIKIRVRGKDFVAVQGDAEDPLPLRDGTRLRVGGATLEVAVDG